MGGGGRGGVGVQMVQAECGLKAGSQLRETLGSRATVAASQSVRAAAPERRGTGVTGTARRERDGRTEQNRRTMREARRL